MTMRRGFTVIEVLIATAILFGAVVVLAAAYLDVLNSYSRMEAGADHNNDLKFARSIVMTEPDLEVVEKGGDFETASGHRVTWKAAVEATTVADLFDVVFECEIAAAELKQPVRMVERFRLLRPTWSKSDDREKLRAEARTRIQELQQGMQSGRRATGTSS